MRYLLDTHILLWALYNSENLTQDERKVLREGKCVISIASLWEIAIKSSIGKLTLKQTIHGIAATCGEYGIDLLDIRPQDCDEMMRLPRIHNDPFDRILIAQAKTNGLTIITRDSFIRQYSVHTL